MVKLIENLHVISGDKLTHPWDASAYLITGSEPVLIDCGSSEGYPALKRNLKQLGYEPKDITRVIATHSHWDHLSGMAQLREESDARLLLHRAEHEQAATGDYNLTSSFLYDRPFPRVQADDTLEDGDVLEVGSYRLSVHHTPGHSPGSVCLLTEIRGTKILIAGDTLYGAYYPKAGSNMEDWTASLDRLLKLEFDVMTIGHCPPTLIFDAWTKVQEARQQLGVAFNPWFKPFYLAFRY